MVPMNLCNDCCIMSRIHLSDLGDNVLMALKIWVNLAIKLTLWFLCPISTSMGPPAVPGNLWSHVCTLVLCLPCFLRVNPVGLLPFLLLAASRRHSRSTSALSTSESVGQSGEAALTAWPTSSFHVLVLPPSNPSLAGMVHSHLMTSSLCHYVSFCQHSFISFFSFISTFISALKRGFTRT